MGLQQEAINALNQVIAVYPWFTPGLTEKAAMLASSNEWEQALDTVQRALDIDDGSIDALKIIAVHAFTQESQPHDALQKLEDLEVAMMKREPNSAEVGHAFACLFSRICSRQPRALQICQKTMERICMYETINRDTVKYLCELGNISLLQGQVDAAMKSFQKASKLDNGSVLALQGMIQCQVIEGHYDDAEAQIDLFHVMHGDEGDKIESISAEFSFYQATLALAEKKTSETDAMRKEKHLDLLERTKKIYLSRVASVSSSYIEPLQELALLDPDFLLQLSVGYQVHIEAPINNSFSSKVVDSDREDESTEAPVGGS